MLTESKRIRRLHIVVDELTKLHQQGRDGRQRLVGAPKGVRADFASARQGRAVGARVSGGLYP